jgi:GrpB-like predicted nucleotidyltransferase (UPF0157 family)
MDEKKREVVLESYQAGWVDQFSEEVRALYPVFWMCWRKVYHIGSTSIPGVVAKPIIDIMPIVHDIQKSDSFNEIMQDMGYVPMGEYGIEGRRYYFKGDLVHTFHIHAFQSDSPHVERHLLFRDYMRTHEKERQAYSDLKLELVKQYRFDPAGYSDAKNDFIQRIDRQALQWKEESGWILPEADWKPVDYV